MFCVLGVAFMVCVLVLCLRSWCCFPLIAFLFVAFGVVSSSCCFPCDVFLVWLYVFCVASFAFLLLRVVCAFLVVVVVLGSRSLFRVPWFCFLVFVVL